MTSAAPCRARPSGEDRTTQYRRRRPPPSKHESGGSKSGTAATRIENAGPRARSARRRGCAGKAGDVGLSCIRSGWGEERRRPHNASARVANANESQYQPLSTRPRSAWCVRQGIAVLIGFLAHTALVAPGAWAADPLVLTLKDHHFTPDRAEVPAGERLQIDVVNQDDTTSEFESHDLKVEKIVAPGGKITVRVGPLKPGSYNFFDDYHPDTATGTITAVEKKG
ncbi:MAG: cupredoxin domain-containing protein [Acetobacteraceae bacterium]|nr:cupredoxin domain-containing protein [Acetobacteraceae bacterium]